MGCFLFVGVLSGSGNKALGNYDGAELMRRRRILMRLQKEVKGENGTGVG
jgi:hypothetical protein